LATLAPASPRRLLADKPRYLPRESLKTPEIVQASAVDDGFSPTEGSASEPQAADPLRLPTNSSSIPIASIPMTLDEAIATSLASNPTLVAQRAAEPVAEAIRTVAGTYPFNPFVQVEVLPYSVDVKGNPAAVQHYVWLMQTLELAHQQRYREASAAAGLNQVRWTIVQAELTSTAATERLYFTALYQRELRDLAQRTATLNDQLLGIVERRFKANLGTPAEQTTARVAARQSHKQAGLAEANYQTALLALRRQLNMPNDAPIRLVGRLEDLNWKPIDGVPTAANTADEFRLPPALCVSLAAERPDVMAAQAGTNAAQSNAELARANMMQNIGIGPYYERDNTGVLMIGFRTQVSLPVWDTGRPLAKQREAEVAQQAATLDQLRSRAQVEVETAAERYERARRLAARERSDFSQTVPEELQRIQRQFAAGQADILNVFAAQNSLVQEERTYLDLLNELAQAASDVTLAAGLPPARLVSAGATEVPMTPAVPAP
jgi:outer membrane protein TolC